MKINNERWLFLEDLPNEKWKDIKEYEGLYKISTYGRVKAYPRIGSQTKVERIMKQQLYRNGYCYVLLNKNYNKKHFKIHRLVAEAFIPDKTTFKSMPYENRNEINLEKLLINHKDENKQNNEVDNLEWCTEKYNNNYGTRIKRIQEKNYKKIFQYDLQGNFIKEWSSLKEACEQLKINKGGVSSCCIGRQKTSKGYIWRYVDARKQ